MKLILSLVVALFSFTATPKAATLYHYEGNAFTDISVTGCCWLRLVADVLFSFDATGVSGTFGSLGGGYILNISFNVVDTLLPQAPVSFGSVPFICDDGACHRQSFTLKTV